ncbi:MAG TPA: EAL domain-containing protein [Ilumatobacteraceae bacterium]|nr:EAL domain-containing protein [Ilumatobacteraceae bacterium]HRB03022.1 EAL domain-containing protein [Ilumatobacteraceae bacterium]
MPVVGLQIFAYREVQAHRSAAQSAAHVRAQVAILQRGGQLIVPLYIEYTATDGVTQAEQQGIDRSMLTDATGVDYLRLVADARAQLDQGLDELVAAGPGVVLSSGVSLADEAQSIREQLTQVRRTFDAEQQVATDTTAVFSRMIALLDELSARSHEVFDSATTTELARVGTETGLLLDTLGFATTQLHLAAQAGIAGGDLDSVIGAVTAAGSFDSSIAELRSIITPDRRAELDAVMQDASFTAVASSLPTWAYSMMRVSSADTQLIDSRELLDSVVDLLTASFDRLGQLQVYADKFLAEEVQIADHLQAEADHDRHNALVVMLAAIGISLILLGLVLLSILRPLGRLTRQSQQVVDGDLALAATKPTGPTDIRVVMRTFNQMVLTLRAYDAQVRRLALGDTQIDKTLPGRLGDTLRQSVTHLAAVTTKLHASEAAANVAARTDSLTGLANRTAALEQLAVLSGQARLDKVSSAIVFLDLDGFKSVNDTQGHAEGDRILGEIGARLRAACPNELIARIGGDEFIVLIDGASDQDEVTSLALHLIDIVSEPCTGSGGQLFAISASAGVSFVDGTRDPLDYVAQADSAVYHAKESGRGRVEVYNARLARDIEERADMALTMRQGLLDNQFSLKLQPIIDVATKQPVGAEALVRWNRPDQGEIGPNDFIPIAERTGVILDIDAWVIEQSINILQSWQGDPLTATFRIAINISGRYIVDGTLSPLLDRLCRQADVDPRMIDLEITETHLIADVARASSVVDDIRRQGIKVAIDDFGTGYSSMSYLHQLTVDTLKIDRVFIAGMCENPLDRTIVELLLRLGDSLGLKVVAEGVDSEDKLTELLAMGCSMAQGFYIARPMPVADATVWLRQQATLAALL